MLFGFPYMTYIYFGSYIFSKQETAFKYVFLFISLITGIEYLIAIAWTDMLKVIPYINPMIGAGYAIFMTIISEDVDDIEK